MTTKINLNGIHELDFNFSGTTTASITSPGVVTVTNSGGGSMVYPGAGIPNSTGSAWGTSYGVNGSGSHVLLEVLPTVSAGAVFTNIPQNGIRFTPSADTGQPKTIYGSNAANSAYTWYIDQSGNATFPTVNALAGFEVNGTALASINLSDSSSLTRTIASGTAAMGTSTIAAGSSATVVSIAATGVLSTDNVIADFNADPTGTTGYVPSTSGGLTIVKWCSSGHVNFKVVNFTGSSITPGSVTLNWRVVR